MTPDEEWQRVSREVERREDELNEALGWNESDYDEAAEYENEGSDEY